MPRLINDNKSRYTFELPPTKNGEGAFVRVGSKLDAEAPKGLKPTVEVTAEAAKHIKTTRVFRALEGRDGLTLR